MTPRIHHLHHAPATSERNLGAVFSVWDRLAGRLLRATAPADATLGVPGKIGARPHGWWPQLCAPLRPAAAATPPAQAARRPADV